MCPVVSDSLRPPRTTATQVPLPVKIFRQRYWSGLPFPTLGDPPTQESNLHLSCSCGTGGFFTTAPLGRPRHTQKMFVSLNFFKMSLVSVTTCPLCFSSEEPRSVSSKANLHFALVSSLPPPQSLGSCMPVSLLSFL